MHACTHTLTHTCVHPCMCASVCAGILRAQIWSCDDITFKSLWWLAHPRIYNWCILILKLKYIIRWHVRYALIAADVVLLCFIFSHYWIVVSTIAINRLLKKYNWTICNQNHYSAWYIAFQAVKKIPHNWLGSYGMAATLHCQKKRANFMVHFKLGINSIVALILIDSTRLFSNSVGGRDIPRWTGW